MISAALGGAYKPNIHSNDFVPHVERERQLKIIATEEAKRDEEYQRFVIAHEEKSRQVKNARFLIEQEEKKHQVEETRFYMEEEDRLQREEETRFYIEHMKFLMEEEGRLQTERETAFIISEEDRKRAAKMNKYKVVEEEKKHKLKQQMAVTAERRQEQQDAAMARAAAHYEDSKSGGQRVQSPLLGDGSSSKFSHLSGPPETDAFGTIKGTSLDDLDIEREVHETSGPKTRSLDDVSGRPAAPKHASGASSQRHLKAPSKPAAAGHAASRSTATSKPLRPANGARFGAS
jgi:hypothetical protein